MHKGPRRVVADGYDAMAERYLAWSRKVVDPTRDRLLDELIGRLPDEARVLDLGCGAGVPWTKRLAEKFEVTGVDISPDLRHAKVFVSVMGSDAEKQATFEGLASTATHLRSRVARALRLRVAPELQFREDETVARAARIESLLAEIRDTSSKPGDASRGD